MQETLDANRLDATVLRDVTDPFRDETRKAKRNLVAAAFIAIVLTSLDVGVTGFVGVAVAVGPDAKSITQGLAGLAVLYFLVAYVVDFFIDYMAWRVSLTRLQVMPYLGLVRALNSNIQQIDGRLRNVAWQLDYHRNPVVNSTPQSYRLAQVNVDGAVKDLEQVASFAEQAKLQMMPQLQRWEDGIRTLAKQVTVRRVARWFRVWIWDCALPLAIAGLAIGKSLGALGDVAMRLLAS